MQFNINITSSMSDLVHCAIDVAKRIQKQEKIVVDGNCTISVQQSLQVEVHENQ
jgi:uncharacterized protein (AIM24 family)